MGGVDFLHDVGHRDLPGELGAQPLWQQRLLVGKRAEVQRELIHGVGHEPTAQHMLRHVVRCEHLRAQLRHAAHAAGLLLPIVLQSQRHQYVGRLQEAALQYVLHYLLTISFLTLVC